jgi:hypothetical protein
MSSKFTKKEMIVSLAVEDEPEMEDSLVRRKFTPSRAEIYYRRLPDAEWRVTNIVITGKDGSAQYGAGNSHRVADAPEWVKFATLEHHPGKSWMSPQQLDALPELSAVKAPTGKVFQKEGPSWYGSGYPKGLTSAELVRFGTLTLMLPKD